MQPGSCVVAAVAQASAAAPIQPLAREFPYAASATTKKQTNKQTKNMLLNSWGGGFIPLHSCCG